MHPVSGCGGWLGIPGRGGALVREVRSSPDVPALHIRRRADGGSADLGADTAMTVPATRVPTGVEVDQRYLYAVQCYALAALHLGRDGAVLGALSAVVDDKDHGWRRAPATSVWRVFRVL